MINFSNYIKCKDENDIIREKYLNKEIFLEGEKIISGGKIGKIIRRCPNYVIALDESNQIFRSWIKDIETYHEEKPKRINKYRNYNHSRDNMETVQSAVLFLGMLPEHSYKIRRTVERTILEGMNYDTAIETIKEDLKSDYLTSKAIEYYDLCVMEAVTPVQKQMQAQKQQMKNAAAQQQLQLQKQLQQKKLQNQKQEAQKAILRQAKKSAAMNEEELDELTITGNLQSYQKPGKRDAIKKAIKKVVKGDPNKKPVGWFKEDEEIEESSFVRREKRSMMNPNEIRVQAQQGSPLARRLRAEKGLGEEEIHEEDPCWDTHTMVGTKIKDGEEVPNCVPKKGVKKAKGFKEELKGNQHKLDVSKPKGKLTAAHFKKLRSMKEQEQVGGASLGFGLSNVSSSDSKKLKKESFSNWRTEINLSDNLIEKIDMGNVIINPSTNDCQNCGKPMKENTCPVCDVNDLRTKYREESYEKHMTKKRKSKREDIVKGMKKNIADLKARYGERWKDVMYATATKMAMAENIEELDEAQDRFGVYDRTKGYWVQSGISQQSAAQLRKRMIASGRSSREIVIRKVKY